MSLKSRLKEAGSRLMQWGASLGVKIGETVERGATLVHWTGLAEKCQDFVESCDRSRKKWKDRADKFQHERILGANTKPKEYRSTPEIRTVVEKGKQVIENNIGDRKLRDVLDSQTPEQRLDFMQKLQDDFSTLCGMELDKIKYYVSPQLECGYYDRDDNSVHINLVFLTSKNTYFVEEQIYTLFHEMMHALQWHVVRRAATENKYDMGFSAEQVAVWADNMLPGHYIRPGVDYEAYRNQPIEIAAYYFEWQLKNEFSI